MYILFIALAVLALLLIPFAPQVVRLRIKIVGWLGWNWAVNLLEKYFAGWVVFVRIALLLIAIFLLVIGWEDLRN